MRAYKEWLERKAVRARLAEMQLAPMSLRALRRQRAAEAGRAASRRQDTAAAGTTAKAKAGPKRKWVAVGASRGVETSDAVLTTVPVTPRVDLAPPRLPQALRLALPYPAPLPISWPR